MVGIDQSLAGTVTKNGAKIKSIVISNSNTVKIINDKGELWSFGAGDRFQNGNNSTSNVATPVQPIANGLPLENVEIVDLMLIAFTRAEDELAASNIDIKDFVKIKEKWGQILTELFL